CAKDRGSWSGFDYW
nr:immunoglobulin heavy chain junction region [Macaca mulatta]